jgi:hypothetical protein
VTNIVIGHAAYVIQESVGNLWNSNEWHNKPSSHFFCKPYCPLIYLYMKVILTIWRSPWQYFILLRHASVPKKEQPQRHYLVVVNGANIRRDIKNPVLLHALSLLTSCSLTRIELRHEIGKMGRHDLAWDCGRYWRKSSNKVHRNVTIHFCTYRSDHRIGSHHYLILQYQEHLSNGKLTNDDDWIHWSSKRHVIQASPSEKSINTTCQKQETWK